MVVYHFSLNHNNLDQFATMLAVGQIRPVPSGINGVLRKISGDNLVRFP